jgi:putative flippase GtrA
MARLRKLFAFFPFWLLAEALLLSIFSLPGFLRVLCMLTIVATEISLLYNFFLNDRYTFHSMLDASRTWLQRCIRFHGPASVGFVLTLLIFSFNHYVLEIRPVIAQAIAIAIVTAVNFVMHRFWTFRPKSTATKAMGRVA